MPKISVIIPCYNQGPYLDEAVESVLCQTFGDFEIIIVNDGSTDAATRTLLRDYARPRTRVIHTENQGLASARNTGIRAARGKYILPLDADDRIGPAYLAEAVRVLETRPHVGIVFCEAAFFGAKSGKWDMPDFSLEEMLIDNVIFCSGMFRRSDWERAGGYDPGMRYGWEDYDFWLTLIGQGRAVYRIPRTLFHYRITESSMLRSASRRRKARMFVRLFRKHRALYRKCVHMWMARALGMEKTSGIRTRSGSDMALPELSDAVGFFRREGARRSLRKGRLWCVRRDFPARPAS